MPTPRLRVIEIALMNIFLGVAFVIFNSRLTIPEFNEFRLKVENIRGEGRFALPAKETYLLKIFGDDMIEKITVNSVAIPHSIFRSRVKLKEFYYILPSAVIKTDSNTINIFPPRRCSLLIKNCISATEFGVILPKNTTIKPPETTNKTIMAALLIFCLPATALLWGLLNYFHLPFGKLLWKYASSCAPCLIILMLIQQMAIFLPFEIYFFRRSFTGLCLLLVAVFQIPTFLSLIIKDGIISLKTSTVSTLHLMRTSGQRILVSGERIAQNAAEHWIVQWWISREFGDKCSVSFFIALFISAFLLSFGFEFLAELVANVAYLALFTAVVIKLKKSRDASENAS